MNDAEWTCYNMALGDTVKEVEMSISGRVTSSSLLPMTDVHINAVPPSTTVSKEIIRVSTLDSIFDNIIQTNERIYLKIDVQGFEIFVLKGASTILGQVQALELELSLAPLYEGGILFVDMIEYMESMGFMAVSFSPVLIDPHTDQLLQMDGIFKRKKR